MNDTAIACFFSVARTGSFTVSAGSRNRKVRKLYGAGRIFWPALSYFTEGGMVFMQWNCDWEYENQGTLKAWYVE